jgi:hypothetical protein
MNKNKSFIFESPEMGSFECGIGSLECLNKKAKVDLINKTAEIEVFGEKLELEDIVFRFEIERMDITGDFIFGRLTKEDLQVKTPNVAISGKVVNKSNE